jgi:hypothetical protein
MYILTSIKITLNTYIIFFLILIYFKQNYDSKDEC